MTCCIGNQVLTFSTPFVPLFGHLFHQISALAGDYIVKVAAGQHFSIALNLKGDIIFSWGRSDSGQLGLSNKVPASYSCETTPKQVAFPDVAGDHLRFQDISCGGEHVVAMTDLGDVYTWGFNEVGATGHDESKTYVCRPQKLHLPGGMNGRENPGSKSFAHNVSAGAQHSLMVVSDQF